MQEATNDNENNESYNRFSVSNSYEASNINQFLKFDCNFRDFGTKFESDSEVHETFDYPSNLFT